jgi:ribosome biogenesis protein YTM1
VQAIVRKLFFTLLRMTETAQVQIRFFQEKTDTDFILPKDLVLSVPDALKRPGLSELVNRIVENTGPVPVDRQYAFLVNGELLMTDLATLFKNKGLSREKVLDIKVISAILPPRDQNILLQEDDWVVSMSAGSGSLWTGQANGCITLWSIDNTPQKIGSFNSSTFSTLPLKQLIVSPTSDTQANAYTAQGHSVSLHSIKHGVSAYESKLLCSIPPESFNNYGTVESMELLGNTLVTGTFDGSIQLWSCSDRNSLEKVSDSRISKHDSSVHALDWSQSSRRLYSSSLDKSIKTWDIRDSHLYLDSTFISPASVLCLDHQVSGLLASGHTDHHVRLWDPRLSSRGPIKTLIGHGGFVTKVLFSTANAPQYILYSISMDGNLLVWDLRITGSNGPLQRINAGVSPSESNSKLLSMTAQPGSSDLLIGDSFGRVQKFSFESNK